MKARQINRLPAGTLHVRWDDRWQREGTVILVADRRKPAYNDAYFAKAIPRWRQAGLARDLVVYPPPERKP